MVSVSIILPVSSDRVDEQRQTLQHEVHVDHGDVVVQLVLWQH